MARFLFIFVWCVYCATVTFNSANAAPVETAIAPDQNQEKRENEPPIDNNDDELDENTSHNNHLLQIDHFKKLTKRSAAPESNHDDYPDYLLGVKYDEYPMIVPKKRAALLIDRLMVALQKAIENEDVRGTGGKTKNYLLRSEDGMDLQRRGHQSVSGQKNGRYWRCYFNAVTCF